MAQNDTHVALIILTTQMWGGGELLVEKTFSGQNLCSCAFGANIRSYTKQRARHGTPFLQPPPPPSFGGRPCHPPPPPPRRAIFRSPFPPDDAPQACFIHTHQWHHPTIAYSAHWPRFTTFSVSIYRARTGGATANGPDATTPPSYLSKPGGGGGRIQGPGPAAPPGCAHRADVAPHGQHRRGSMGRRTHSSLGSKLGSVQAMPHPSPPPDK